MVYPVTTTIQYLSRKHNEEALEEWESGISEGGR